MGAPSGVVMRLSLVFLCLVAACFPSQSSLSQSCEPTASARAVLEQLQVPDIAHLPAAQRRELKLQLLCKALAAAPSDIALHEAYQNARLGGMEINRPDSIAEYEQLLAKHAKRFRFPVPRGGSTNGPQDESGHRQPAASDRTVSRFRIASPPVGANLFFPRLRKHCRSQPPARQICGVVPSQRPRGGDREME